MSCYSELTKMIVYVLSLSQIKSHDTFNPITKREKNIYWRPVAIFLCPDRKINVQKFFDTFILQSLTKENWRGKNYEKVFEGIDAENFMHGNVMSN
jgi:hypothetical protein